MSSSIEVNPEYFGDRGRSDICPGQRLPQKGGEFGRTADPRVLNSAHQKVTQNRNNLIIIALRIAAQKG